MKFIATSINNEITVAFTGRKNMSYGYGRNRGYGGRGNSSGFNSGFRPFKPKPVEVGKEYQLDITEVSKRGDGVAKIEGFVIFVSGAKVGQKATVKITNVANRFATAELVSVVTEQPAQGESAPPAGTTESAPVESTESTPQ